MNERIVHVFRDPDVGGYATSLTFRTGASMACAAVPDAMLELAELFPD